MVAAAIAAIIVVVTVRETTHSGESRETLWCALLAPRWLTRGAEGTVQKETHTQKKKHEGCTTKKGGCDTDAVSLLPCTSRSSPSTHHPTTCSLTHAPPTPSPQNPQSRNKRNTSAGRQARILSLVARPLNKEERQRPAVFFFFLFLFVGKKKHTYTQVCA